MTLPALNALTDFFNNRQPREKKMLVVLAVALLIFLDYFLVARPILGVFTLTGPKLHQIRQELRTLKEDQKNKDLISQRLARLQTEFENSEKSFVAAGEFSALLENLSKLAGSSGVKIISLSPVWPGKDQAGKAVMPVLIEISALAGTHDLGKFLVQLESGPVFFKISALGIAENPANPRKHTVNLKLEVLTRKVV
jgi:Tfp pilus assembly protein PilO